MNSKVVSNLATRKHWTFKGHENIGLDHWNRVKGGTRLGKDARLKRDIPFDVTIEQAWAKFLEQKGRCAITGIELDWTYSRGPRGSQVYYRGSASLDRIDSKMGYEKHNIQWVHKDVNALKSDMAEAEFLKWRKLIAQHATA